MDSKANKLIQAADLLCGYIFWCFRDAEKYSNIEKAHRFNTLKRALHVFLGRTKNLVGKEI